MTGQVAADAIGEAYGTRAIKRRRRTRKEISDLQAAIYNVLWEDRPQTVRHVYYRVVSLPDRIIEKNETGYRTVQHQLLKMREQGMVPWSWVSDGTRWRIQAESFDTRADAIRHAADTYRRDLWRRTPVYIEVWCESDSMAGVLHPETDRYNVSLMSSRGFSSKSFLYHSAMTIQEQGRPAYLYYVGDWDPSGKLIPEDIEATLRRFAPKADIHFNRLLVTPDQINKWDLPTKPAKRSTHSKGFTGGTVEAEAMPANVTRQLVRGAIESHLDMREVEVMRVAEKSEAEWLKNLAGSLEEGGVA